MIRIGQTRGTLLDSVTSTDHYVLERVGWYSGPHLHELIDLLEHGSNGLLGMIPSSDQFQLCCHAFWSRHTTPPPLRLPLPAAGAGAMGPVNDDDDEETMKMISSPQETLQHAIDGMDANKAIQAILEGVVISPELVEHVSVHIGDKYIPLVAILLSNCVPYVAKRILLNDCQEMVMRCNNPLTALMIGHHISR